MAHKKKYLVLAFLVMLFFFPKYGYIMYGNGTKVVYGDFYLFHAQIAYNESISFDMFVQKYIFTLQIRIFKK